MTEEIEVSEVVEEAPSPTLTAAREEASRFGWTDRETWEASGKDAAAWVDADTFLARGREYNGFLRKENERFSRELREVKETLNLFKQHHEKVSQQAYDKALKTLKEQRKEAIKNGDVDTQLAVEEHLEELQASPPQPIVPESRPEQPEVSPEAKAAFQEWNSVNSWYGTNQAATEFADDVGRGLAGKVTGVAYLKRVEKAVRAEFPHLFSNPAREAAPGVDSGSARGALGSGKNSFSALPVEAKQAFAKFARQGIYKDDAAGRATYAAEYFEGE